MITDLIDDLDILKEFETLLNYETIIDIKKKHKIKLSNEEFFFDNYLIKPSTLLRLIERRLEK